MINYKCSSIEKNDIDGCSYVGINKHTESYNITTPHGFVLPESIEIEDREQIRNIKKYARCINKALGKNKKRQGFILNKDIKYNPLSALFIVTDYIQNGLYQEVEKEDAIRNEGKINFRKTIKKLSPFIVNNKAYYTDFVVTKKKNNAEKIVSVAQGNVINHFMKNGGEILFGSLVKVNVPAVKLDKSLTQKLAKEKALSFNTRKQQLIQWIIDYIDGAIIEKVIGDWQYSIVASSLWEEMVDGCYSNQTYRNKTLYGQQYRLLKGDEVIVEGKSSEHDTIYEDENAILIIDAKMYYSESGLTSGNVLDKQVGYYMEAKLKNPDKRIYNVLIKPYVEGQDAALGYCGIIPTNQMRLYRDADCFVILYTVDFQTMMNNYYNNVKIGGKLLNEIRALDIDTSKYMQ